eukprot:Skav210075  [mRNA]  locus=scaffold7699:14183:18616:+ [translate_table: standard]
MPLPYQSCFRPGTVEGEDVTERSFQRGLCLAILVLNWLHLRRPAVAPPEICFGQKLSSLQWKAVRQMERTMLAWKRAPEVAAADMGRTASKVEDIETVLNQLSSFESVANEILFNKQEEQPSNVPQLRRKGRFAPGLQRVPIGEWIGTSRMPSTVPAKPIQSDRLEFQGTPNFNPAPFLDARSRSIFEHPIQNALSPEEAVLAPPPVKIHAAAKEKDKLYQKLDACGRLGMVDEAEALAGFQAGLFCVIKNMKSDRLIFDSRPFNTLERPPGRWVKAMASISPLLDLQLRDEEVCLISSTDLRDFYYSFSITPERLVRNTLVGSVLADEYSHFQCYDASKHRGRRVYFSLNSLAMGDTNAVELAQTAHLGLLIQADLIHESNLVAMDMAIPREKSFAGVVIDDLVVFEILLKAAWNGSPPTCPPQPRPGCKLLDDALAEYRRVGLLPHPDKTYHEQVQGDFWGCHMDGEHGLIMANLKRSIPVMAVTARVLKMGFCSVGLLEVLTGAFTSIFLFRRRLLCLLNLVYQAGHGEFERNHVIRLSPELQEELFLCLCLCPLAVTNMKVDNAEHIYCSDASEWGIGVTRALLPGWLQREVHRHKLRKSVWVHLLSPLKSLQRIRGVLPTAEELPEGQTLASHPLWIVLASSLKYTEVCRKRMPAGRHINVLELRGMLKAESEAAKKKFPARVFNLADSQVALGCWVKGRSSSYGLNQELQQSLGIHLGCGMYSNAGYVPTEVNTADDPTRGVKVREPEASLPAAFESAGEGDLGAFDEWLASYSADTFSTSGLPSLDELRKPSQVDSAASLSCDPTPESWCTPDASGESVGGELPLPGSSTSVRGGLSPTTARWGRGAQPSSDSLLTPGVTPAPATAGSGDVESILFEVPLEQFVLQAVAQEDWRPSTPGFLDLYSGRKGVARAMASMTSTWVITFELEDGANQDVMSPTNKSLIERLLRSGLILGVGAAIFCSSFSRAVRPPVRSAAMPYGFSQMSAKMFTKVSLGNAHARWLANLLKICVKLGLLYWVENPDGSYLWYLDEFLALGSRKPQHVFRIDYCTMGTAWRKRSRFLTSTHLRGQKFWCSRDHVHLRLSGWSKVHGKSWTRVAQTYPKRLCNYLARAMLVDSGLLPERFKVDFSLISRCSHHRIGEAKNPGPRKGPTGARVNVDLANVKLVTAATDRLGRNIWDGFLRWLADKVGRDFAEELVLFGSTLDILLAEFGHHLFRQGQSLYLMRQLVTFAQRTDPRLRNQLNCSWDVIKKWESVEPVCHRTPMPWAIYKAMVALSISLQWYRFACVMMLCFEGICRPGEALAALREDVLLPSDLLSDSLDRAYLRIKKPKSRMRGLGLVQHATISHAAVVSFLEKKLKHVPFSQRIYPGSPVTFRRRWDWLLAKLSIPETLGLTPASMRGGGAVRVYRENDDVSRLLWKMRLKNLETLQHYLQEVGAEAVTMQLSLHSRNAVLAASSLFDACLSAAS